MLGQHRPDDLADVFAGVAVLGGRLAPRGGEQRVGEPIDLRARVVEVVLGADRGALGAQQPGQRVPNGRPPYPADVDRPGRVGRDELEVDALSGQSPPVPVGLALIDDGTGHCSRGRGNEPDVQEPGARDLDALDGRVAGQLVGDGLRQDARRQARLPGHLEREIRGVVTVAGIPRPLDSRHRRQHGPIQVPIGQHGRGRGRDQAGQLGGSHTRMLELWVRLRLPGR